MRLMDHLALQPSMAALQSYKMAGYDLWYIELLACYMSETASQPNKALCPPKLLVTLSLPLDTLSDWHLP